MARGDQLGRQWKIFQILIDAKTGRSVADIADRLECHTWTVYRDLEALQTAGFPIYDEKQRGKSRWFMLESQKGISMPLSMAELTALCFGREFLNILKDSVFHDSLKSFYMTGHCHLRHEILTFACDRIRDIALSDELFTASDDFEIDGYLQSSFGVFHGRMTRVKIWFSPEAAMHIKERQWHASQEIMDQPDGSIIFSAETAGIHDIRIWVLSWGAKARVLAPESLKEMIKSEVEALNRLYE